MEKVLVDTDVVLDFFFDRKPFSEHAAKLFSLCELKQIEAFITPVICSNAYYLLRQNSTHEKAIEKLSLLLSITNVLVMDRDTILNAINSDFKDFEDALQNFAAAKSGFVDIILTRNVKDYKTSELGVMTPESYLQTRIVGK